MLNIGMRNEGRRKMNSFQVSYGLQVFFMDIKPLDYKKKWEAHANMPELAVVK